MYICACFVQGSGTAIIDLEAMDLKQKLAFLREHRYVCMDVHADTMKWF